MNMKIANQFIYDESGQGITEYGAILAFVALLIAVAFTQSTALQQAINKAYNEMATQLNAVST
ncbi:MAG: hypothetical protein K2Y22_05805 [Candidatus Obscuribacterales bacterium]|nr:hypothetical protein [Candidatus Obscuribacterales bacterium]